MRKLIKAFTIFAKYSDECPTWCEHDCLHVCVNPERVSSEDIAELDELGFHMSDDPENDFYSYKYGSC